jgi:hypothetical protein
VQAGDPEVGDRWVVVISVARREQGFAQTADGQVVVRRDAMNTALIGTQLADFVTRHALARFETTPTSCPSDVADAVLVAELAQAYGWSAPVSERLVERGLVIRQYRHRPLPSTVCRSSSARHGSASRTHSSCDARSAACGNRAWVLARF